VLGPVAAGAAVADDRGLAAMAVTPTVAGPAVPARARRVGDQPSGPRHEQRGDRCCDPSLHDFPSVPRPAPSP